MALSQAKDLDDLKTCDDTSSLWKHNMDPFIRVTDDKMKLVGSYLFCYDKWGRFIRSGKVYGAKVDYGTRYKQHMQSARLQDADDQRSKFYCTFPSIQSTVDTTGMKKGVFEHLNMFIGTGFDKHNCSLLVKDVADGGIFQWTKEAIQLARTCHGTTLDEQKVEMVSYLLEVIDDLMIEPSYRCRRCNGRIT